MKITPFPSGNKFALDTTNKQKLTIITIQVLILIWFVFSPTFSKADEINYYEKEIIQKRVNDTFKSLIQYWQEELYFDMYDFGQKKSRDQINRENFAQRMVELKWRPAVGKDKIVIKDLKLFYRNYGVIKFEIEFQHKTLPTRIIKKVEEFNVVLEDKKWKFDLTRIIKIPF